MQVRLAPPRKMRTTAMICEKCNTEFQGSGRTPYCPECRYEAFKRRERKKYDQRQAEYSHPLGITVKAGELWCIVNPNTLLPVDSRIYSGVDIKIEIKSGRLDNLHLEQWAGKGSSKIYRVHSSRLTFVKELPCQD